MFTKEGGTEEYRNYKGYSAMVVVLLFVDFT